MNLYSIYAMCILFQDKGSVVIRRVYIPILVPLSNSDAVHIWRWTSSIIPTAVSIIEWRLFSEKRTNLKHILRDVGANYSLQVT